MGPRAASPLRSHGQLPNPTAQEPLLPRLSPDSPVPMLERETRVYANEPTTNSADGSGAEGASGREVLAGHDRRTAGTRSLPTVC